MRDVNETIRSLEYTYTLWEEEYKNHGPLGDRQSAMRKSDLLFLRRKIDRLKGAQKRLASLCDLSMDEVNKRF